MSSSAPVLTQEAAGETPDEESHCEKWDAL